MAEKEDTEQKLNSEDEAESTPSGEKAEGTVKKVTKKRAAKKKVAKKRAAKKRVVSKKTAVKAVLGIDKESLPATGEGVAEEGDAATGEGVIDDQRSVAGTKEVKADIRGAAAASSRVPREVKSTMSEQPSKAIKSSPIAGFWSKVLVWVIVVLAAFMYIRSLAHKGQTVKQAGSPASTAVIGSAAEKERPADRALRPAAAQSGESSTETVAKEKGIEPGVSTADSKPPAAVRVAPIQTVREADLTAVSGVEQSAAESAGVASEVGAAAQETVVTSAGESGEEPVASTDSGAIDESSSSNADVSVPTAESVAIGAADAKSQAIDTDSETVVVIEQSVPTVVVLENTGDARELPETPVGATPDADSSGAEAALDTVMDPIAVATTPQSVVTSSAAVNAAPEQEALKRDFSVPGGRPSFKELFGYERPEPPVRRPDYGSRKSFPPDSSEPQGLYPAPWHYAPRQPRGGGYPGHYGPYGNYGGYPYYPAMPEWAPYQPYGYGPPGY